MTSIRLGSLSVAPPALKCRKNFARESLPYGNDSNQIGPIRKNSRSLAVIIGVANRTAEGGGLSKIGDAASGWHHTRTVQGRLGLNIVRG